MSERPGVVVFDVNETLSDLAPMAQHFADVGAPGHLAATWFASVLRDGFALSLQRRAPAFLDLARQDLRRCLTGQAGLRSPVEEVVDAVLDTLSRLDVHPDVGEGIRALTDDGHRVTAFSNGSESATRGLLERAGVLDRMTRVLSVEPGNVWKPHPAAYARAAEALAAAPSSLTMVAAHPWDLDGASRARLRTAWLDRDGLPWPESFRAPDHRVTRLGELRDVAASG